MIIAELTTILAEATSLGAAGLIGAMWLLERRSNAERERQLTDAHSRILADRVQLESLVDLVRQNTQTMTRLVESLDRILQEEER